MDLIEQIKNVDIKQVLDLLWVKTNNKKWLWDRDENKYSDSYTYSLKYNLVKSHNQAKEWRPDGNPLNFYVLYTWQSVREAIKWFWENFNLDIDTSKYKEIEERYVVDDKDILSSYLFLRRINYGLLPVWLVTLVIAKTYWKNAPEWSWKCLSIEMKDIKWEVLWYQYRSLIWKWFYTNWMDWLFYSFTKNLKSDYIILVEWASDFLTVRQYTEQVIWFKSASARPDPNVIGFINKFQKIYLLFDNDDAWKKCKELFKDSIDADIYEIDAEEDVNELWVELWEWLIETILWWSVLTKEKTFALIDYNQWLSKWYEELKERKVDSVMSRWFEKFDNYLWYLLPWQLIVVWWITWIWKSTVVNQIANNVARQWFAVARMSLEDRLEENRINDIYYETNRLRMKQAIPMPSHSKFEANLFTEEEYQWINYDIQQAIRNLNNYNKWIIDLFHKKMVDIVELENLFKDVVINKWVSLVVIDHLHYVKFEKDQRHDLAIETFMHQLNDLLRKYKVACILVSHYKKLQKDEEPDNNSFKDWAAIAQVANKVIHIDKDKWEVTEDWDKDQSKSIRYIITKNRWKSWTGVIFGRYDNWRIIMWESELSKDRRKKKNLWFNFNKQW